MQTTPRFTRNASYKQWLVDELQRAVAQAKAEGEALAGKFGVERQLRAMSERYKRLKAAGKLDEAAEVKAAGLKIIAAQKAGN